MEKRIIQENIAVYRLTQPINPAGGVGIFYSYLGRFQIIGIIG